MSQKQCTLSLNQSQSYHQMTFSQGFLSCHILFLALTLLTPAEQTFYPATSNEITYSGRRYIVNETVNYDWPCFRIAFCFKESTKVEWEGKDTWNYYDVVLDEKQQQRIKPGRSSKFTLFESKQPESYCLQLIKITQNHYGPIASHTDSLFKGIELTGGVLLQKQEHFSYKFDFLGDSLTTAFGVLSGTNPICFLRMKQIQTCRESWATHISKLFNADSRIMAVSGKGVFHNSFGVPGPKIGTLYTRTTDNSKPFSYKYQDGVIPDVIFFLIGANDYSHPINPNPNKFIFAYKQMLETTLKELWNASPHSQPLFINVCASEFPKEQQYTVKTAVKEFSLEYKYTYYVQVPKGVFGNLGCIGHPNVKGQRLIAETLYPQVKAILDNPDSGQNMIIN